MLYKTNHDLFPASLSPSPPRFTFIYNTCSHEYPQITMHSSSGSLDSVSGEGNSNPLQYSCLENTMDEGAWWAAVPGVVKSRRLSNFTSSLHFHALEKETATHSSILARRIPGTAELDGLPSVGLHRGGHDWSDLAAAADSVRSQSK